MPSKASFWSRSVFVFLFAFFVAFFAPLLSKAQYGINAYEYWEYDCLTCLSTIVIEVTGPDLKNKLESKKLSVELYHKDFISPPERIVWGSNPDAMVVVFQVKLHKIGLQKYVVHVLDINQNGTRRVAVRKILDINVVQVPKLIDTATERCWPCIIDDDSLKATGDTLRYTPVLTTKGFNFFVDRPRVLTKKGKKIKNGFDNYFLQVIRTNTALIDGLRMRKAKEDNKFYLAVVTRTKKAPRYPRYLDSKALFIKGIEDDMSNSVKQLKIFKKYTKRRMKFHRRRFKQMPRVKANGKGMFGKIFKRNFPITDSMNILIYNESKRKFHDAKDYMKLKKKFIRAKRNPRKLPKFFLRPYFTKRTLKYNIRPNPYGLPQLPDYKKGRGTLKK